MTGNGTSTNPYVISTAEELYSLSTLGGSEVYCKLGRDIDLNGTQYAENFQVIPINCISLDGNGHSIRNIVYSDSTATVSAFKLMVNGTQIKNTVFENIRLSGKDVTLFTKNGNDSSTVNFEKCVFAVNADYLQYNVLSSGAKRCLFHKEYIKFNCNLCTFSVSANFYMPQSVISDSTLNRCQFNLNIKFINAISNYSELYSCVSYCNVSECYFIGAVKFTGASSNYYFTGSNSSDSYSNFSASYIALDLQNLNNFYFSANFMSVCFYDSTRTGTVTIRSNVSATASRLLGLTTAQCKNAEYLRSVGFECEEG